VDVGALHVAAACAGLAVGLVVLVRRKGGPWHIALGRVFLASMILVNLPVLVLYEDTGRPGPFHLLAVVSLVTTTLGWVSLRRRPRGRSAIAAHASFMTWSWIGVATAGLAQFGNREWPEHSPWPVAVVVGLATVIGLVWVPRYVSHQLTAHPPQRKSSGTDRRGEPVEDVDGLDAHACSR
jgi:uncharacterized membrane protein